MRLIFTICLLSIGTRCAYGFIITPSFVQSPVSSVLQNLISTLKSAIGVSSNPNDILFYFYPYGGSKTKIVYNNYTSLAAANFNPNLPTVVISDGFFSTSTTEMTLALSESYPKKYGSAVNTLVVDFAPLSGANLIFNNVTYYPSYFMYPIVMTNTPIVAKRIAEFIKFLGVNPSNVRLVGLSWGAHLIGMAGAYAQKLYGNTYSRISGLDPSGPLFTGNLTIPQSYRLNSTNAVFVDVYHSDMGQAGTTDTDNGNIDIVVNSGIYQPGCGPLDYQNGDTPLTSLVGSCSHQYSWRFFNYTIFNDVFAEPCDASQYLLSSCFQRSAPAEFNPTLLVGENISPSASGKYRAYIDNAFTSYNTLQG